MKSTKNWMMLMVVGTMLSASIKASDQTEASTQVETKKSIMQNLKEKSVKAKAKVRDLAKKVAAKVSTFDGRRAKAMLVKVENLKNKLPGMFDNAIEKVKNGKASDAIKDMKSKMEILLEKARKGDFIKDDQVQNIRKKFNDMQEKLQEKLNKFKSSGSKVVSEDVINFINQNSENLKNNIKKYLDKAENKINSMMQG